MNKNNYLLRFAHFYIANIKGIKEKIIDVWYEIVDNIESLLIILITPIALVVSIISIVFPLKQIILACLAQYLTTEKLKELYVDKEAGYFFKGSIKKRKAEIKQELEEEKEGRIAST